MTTPSERSVHDAPRPGAFSPTVERYLGGVLQPQLEAFGVRPYATKIVACDIGSRLDSLLARWSDTTFRATALLPALEEATFYEPLDAPIEIRALVVAGVRNSLLEDLNATRGSHPKLKPLAGTISDEWMPEITKAAIAYFASVDAASLAASVPKDDIFGHLPERCPRAWAAISELARMPEKEKIRTPPDDPDATPAKAPPLDERLVGNGIAWGLSLELANLLANAQASGVGLFSDSFKMVSRNPEKLLWVIEFLLSQNLALFTFNYYLSNKYLARREPLLRPARGVASLSATQIPEKFTDVTGLTARHKEAIEDAQP